DWPSHRRSIVTNATADYIYEIDESGARPAPAQPPVTSAKTGPGLFQDVSTRLSHSHNEAAFDDFGRQPTLPKRLSQLGPGICWCDSSGNGRDDLLIGTGKGGRPALFLNDGKGQFQPAKSAW